MKITGKDKNRATGEKMSTDYMLKHPLTALGGGPDLLPTPGAVPREPTTDEAAIAARNEEMRRKAKEAKEQGRASTILTAGGERGVSGASARILMGA